MVVRNLPLDEQLVTCIAWGLASRKAPGSDAEAGVMIAEHKDNLRMQELIVEWALAGYLPAQRLWARITEARFG